MARFDPNTYPDRLAFEAYARRVRARELDRIFAGMWPWLRQCSRALAGRATAIGTVATAARHSQPAH